MDELELGTVRTVHNIHIAVIGWKDVSSGVMLPITRPTIPRPPGPWSNNRQN